jgi:hypothetical protein
LIIFVGVYATFRMGMVDLAQSACGGGGCEDRLNGERDHYRRLLELALFGGGGLFVTGIIAVVALKKRIAQSTDVVLPTATARTRTNADI